MSKAKWISVSVQEFLKDSRSPEQKERDRLEGLERAAKHAGKRKGGLPNYDLMCDRVFDTIVPSLQEQMEIIRFKENEIERLNREIAQKKERITQLKQQREKILAQ